MKNDKLEMTPLQKVVGFEVAEETYDQLPFMAQLILDLKIVGWKDSDIARCLNMPRTTVVDTFTRTRYALANSKLKMILETRVYYRETHSSSAPEEDPTRSSQNYDTAEQEPY